MNKALFAAVATISLSLAACGGGAVAPVDNLALAEAPPIEAASLDNPLPSRDQRDLLERLRRYIKVSDYYAGGCQDRAQAAYMLADPDVRRHLQKIWVITPAPASGGITLPSTYISPLTLDFHVALSFRDEQKGTIVYDACLAPDRFVDQGEWLGMFTYSAASAPQTTPGNVYTYDRATRQFTTYSSDLHRQVTVPRSLARDKAVGPGYVCPHARSLFGRPTQLGEYLHSSMATPEEDGPCGPNIIAYKFALYSWDSHLRPSQLTVPDTAADKQR